MIRRLARAAAPCLAAACALLPAAAAPAASAAVPYKAVLIAGDGSLPVFDNAMDGVAADLRRAGAASDIVRLSGTGAGRSLPATVGNVVEAIAAMRPAAGQGCLVFATSHGVHGGGLYLSAEEEVLTPATLDRALQAGCGSAPTVVVVSSCFSGSFAQAPMARPNRVILTAARVDRTSFGCGAGETYTVYDRCLLGRLDKRGTWPVAYDAIRRCVGAEERREGVTPSLPQAWFGGAVAGLTLPTGPAAP